MFAIFFLHYGKNSESKLLVWKIKKPLMNLISDAVMKGRMIMNCTRDTIIIIF